MKSVQEFLSLSRRDLGQLLEQGNAIDPAALDDWEYRGISLGLPAWVDRLAWKTFVKTFHRDPNTGALRGWNVRLQQTGLDGPVEPLRKNGTPISFGHFRVEAFDGYRMPRRIPRGLMLDYGRGGNAALDPTRSLRDPIVALESGNSDWLLGWSYLDLGLTRVGTPSFFLLQRHAPLKGAVPAPNSR